MCQECNLTAAHVVIWVTTVVILVSVVLTVPMHSFKIIQISLIISYFILKLGMVAKVPPVPLVQVSYVDNSGVISTEELKKVTWHYSSNRHPIHQTTVCPMRASYIFLSRIV